MEREEKLCFNDECIYKETCAKWLMNIPDDNEEDMFVVTHHDLKKYTCYVPIDGRIL